MSRLYVNWSTGLVERQYRGARTVRFVAHMRPASIERLQTEITELLNAGYAPTKYGSGWLYSKGAQVA